MQQCSAITNNCAESANAKIKNHLELETLTPLELIDSLRKLNNHQLNFKQFISKKGDFIFTGGSLELNGVDKEFIYCLYDQFFESDLFSSSVEESNIINIKKCIENDEIDFFNNTIIYF